MINLTNTTQLNLSDWGIGFLQKNCTGRDYFSVECLNKNFCPQISGHLVRYGFIVVVLYFIIKILTDFFIGFGGFIVADKHDRMRIAITIYETLSIMMLMYIVVVLYFNL